MAETAKLRVGILGAGGIFGAHMPAFVKVADRCEVVAVAESDPRRDEVVRKLAGPGPRIVRDYREVLAMPEVQAVDILLPHNLHMPAAIAAAAAGKHVLVEKVMARNVWECDRMIEACERAKVSLTVCHDRRYHGEWTTLKQVVDSGALGEVFFWKLDHNQDVPIPPTSWAHWKDGIGGGCIMSCLTHQIDALRWYGGEVAGVTCMTGVRPERMQGEFLGVVTARMKSGALAELSINWWTRSNTGENKLWYEMVQACGTRGEAYRMEGRGTYVRLHDPANKAAVERYGQAALTGFVRVESDPCRGHDRCVAEWVAMLRGEPSRVITRGRECRGTVEVAEAAYLSAETGRHVALPIEPQPWKPAGMPDGLVGLAASRQ